MNNPPNQLTPLERKAWMDEHVDDYYEFLPASEGHRIYSEGHPVIMVKEKTADCTLAASAAYSHGRLMIGTDSITPELKRMASEIEHRQSSSILHGISLEQFIDYIERNGYMIRFGKLWTLDEK